MVSKTKVITCLLSFATLVVFLNIQSAQAVEQNTSLEVNVKESLSVSIYTPATPPRGDAGEFLRNKVSLNVVSNNSAGFTASMTAKTTDTFLTNTTVGTAILPTLASNTTKSNFPANYWGYSLDDTEEGSDTSTYGAMVASNGTPITLLYSANATNGSKDFYFGAKADVTQASGTYNGTVIVNVVSGVIDPTTNPVVPTNPAVPAATENTAAYSPTTGGTTAGTTTYTYTRTNPTTDTTIKTTEVSDGDNTDMYTGYTPPQGVTTSTGGTTSNRSSNLALASGLAAISSLSAAGGTMFFLMVKNDEE